MNLRKTAGRLLLLLSLALMLTGAAAADTNPLSDLLALVPAPAAGDRLYLSYADYEALMAHMPGDWSPAQTKAAAAGGNPDAVNGLNRQQAAETNGIALSMLKQNLHVMLPPLQMTLLAGDFDREQIHAALMAQEYQALDDPGKADAAWCLGGNCDSVQGTGLIRSNPAFFFGGIQGEGWPVALFGNMLATSQDVDLFARVKGQEGPRLLDLPAVQALLAALQPAGSPPLAQLILVDANSALGEAFSTDRLLAIAQSDEGDALIIQVSLQFEEAAEAQAAGERLNGGLPDVELKTGDTFQQRLEQQKGSLQEVQVEGKLLTLRFNFPGAASLGAAAPQGPADSPFGMFYMLLMYQDLGWLVA